jgi:hypothetical protein
MLSSQHKYQKSNFINLNSLFLLFFFTLFAFTIKSCAIVSEEQRLRSKQLTIKELPRWKAFRMNKEVDFSYYYKKDPSLLFYSHSLCHRYSNTTLDQLAKKNIANLIFNQECITFPVQAFNRDAILALARIQIDGVLKEYMSLTLRHNHCLYDFALIGSKIHEFKKYYSSHITQLSSLNNHIFYKWLRQITIGKSTKVSSISSGTHDSEIHLLSNQQ